MCEHHAADGAVKCHVAVAPSDVAMPYAASALAADYLTHVDFIAFPSVYCPPAPLLTKSKAECTGVLRFQQCGQQQMVRTTHCCQKSAPNNRTVPCMYESIDHTWGEKVTFLIHGRRIGTCRPPPPPPRPKHPH